MGLISSAQPVYRDVADAAARARAAALDPKVMASLSCDVSFASDDSTPPEALVARQIEKLSNPDFAALWWNVYDRLRGDGVIAHRARVVWHVESALRDAGINADEQWLDALSRFFDRINQVMFQHETLGWLAEANFKLHLYGAGWDAHPKLAPFARGEIDSDAMRLAIYRASRINLAAGVYGAMSLRVSEGVGAGGFFLLRFTPADLLERFFPPMYDFCVANGIESNAQLADDATPVVRELLDFAGRTIGVHPLHAWPDFLSELRSAADAGYTRSAAAIWPQYPSVVFSTRDELVGLVERYLYDVPERQRIAEEMRRELRARFEHVQVNHPPVQRSHVAA